MARTSALLPAAVAAVAIVALVAVFRVAARRRGTRRPGVRHSGTGGRCRPDPARRGCPSSRSATSAATFLTAAALRGHWSLVFPGFTHCPDICPTTLAILDRAHDLLGPTASALQVILLSVDPERDTPEALARYLAFFNPGFAGVTGEQEQLQRLYTGLGVQHIRIPGARGEYSVDHSAALLLVDPEGRLAGYFMPPFQAERLAADLGPLLAASIQE